MLLSRKSLLYFFLCLGTIGFFYSYHLLSPQKPVNGQLLVVEGFVTNRDYELKKVLEIYEEGNYSLLVVTGLQFPSGEQKGSCSSTAERAANRLEQFGFTRKDIIAVSAPYNKRHRTYHKAKAFSRWLYGSNLSIHSLDIVSVGAHSAYTHVLFKRVLRKDYKVGIITVNPENMSSWNWFLSFKGLRYTIEDIIGFFYAHLWVFE